MSKEIFGITGHIGAGKTTASEILQSIGYTLFSLSGVVKDETISRGLQINDRSILQDVGDNLRKTYGSNILAKRTIDTINKSGVEKAVIDGIRNPAELKYIQSIGGMIIGINSLVNLREQRVIERANLHDPTSHDEFKKDEVRDRGVGQKDYGQQTDECLALADINIENNGKLEEFKAKILDLPKYFLTPRVANGRP